MKTLKKIIQQTIDIHLHIGPEIIPRKYTVEKLIAEEQGNISGFVLKNHFYPTMPFIKEVEQTSTLSLFGAIVLNNAVGGLNPEAIYATRLLTDKPFVVWFPTINADNFLRKNTYEIAPEWIKGSNVTVRKSQEVISVYVTQKGILTKEAEAILWAIKNYQAILATGHIAWEESMLLVNKALALGIKNIVITHPIYQSINMPITLQKTLAKQGCFIEIPYSMYAIDGIPLGKIVKQIQIIGSQYIILSSDVGQLFSPSPSKALYFFASTLMKYGITLKQLEEMLVNNPRRLLEIQ